MIAFFRNHTFLLLFMLLFLTEGNTQENNWELKKQQNGIQVYTRSIEGFKLEEFKGIIEIDFSVKEIAALIKNVDSHPEWIKDCSKAELLKQTTDKMWVYSVTKAPFPVNDRDGIALFSFHKIENALKIELKGKADYLAPKKDLVRIPYLNGFWLLEKQSNQKTKVTYQIHADPGGSVPAWLANATAVDMPFETLSNLRAYLNR